MEMSSRLKQIPDELKKVIRAVVVSAPKAQIELGNFNSEFRNFAHVPFYYKKFGFSSLQEALESISDVVCLKYSPEASENYILTAIISSDLKLPKFLANRGNRDEIIKKSEQSRKLRMKNDEIHKLHSPRPASGASLSEENQNPNCQLYLGNLPSDYSDSDISNILQGYNCTDIKQVKKNLKHFAFVKMRTENDAHCAERQLSNKEVGGRKLIIRQVVNRSENFSQAPQHIQSKIKPPPLESFSSSMNHQAKNPPPLGRKPPPLEPFSSTNHQAKNPLSLGRKPPPLEPFSSSMNHRVRTPPSFERKPPPLEPFSSSTNHRVRTPPSLERRPPPLKKVIDKQPVENGLKLPTTSQLFSGSGNLHERNAESVVAGRTKQNHLNLNSEHAGEKQRKGFYNRPSNRQLDQNQGKTLHSRNVNKYHNGYQHNEKYEHENSGISGPIEASKSSSKSGKPSSLVEVCIANFPYHFTKEELRDLVLDFQPMKIIMGNNKHLPPPNDITHGYAYFYDQEIAERCIEVLDNFLFEDNVLYAFLEDEEVDSDDNIGSDGEEVPISELVSQISLRTPSYGRSNGTEESEDDIDEGEHLQTLTSNFDAHSKRKDCTENFSNGKHDYNMGSKLYNHHKNADKADNVNVNPSLAIKLYPKAEQKYNEANLADGAYDKSTKERWHNNDVSASKFSPRLKYENANGYSNNREYSDKPSDSKLYRHTNMQRRNGHYNRRVQ